MWLVENYVPRCAPLPSSNLVPFGRWRQARGREHCRGDPGSALSGGYALDLVGAEGKPDRRRFRGVREPLCAKIKGANREVSEGKLISDQGTFSS